MGACQVKRRPRQAHRRAWRAGGRARACGGPMAGKFSNLDPPGSRGAATGASQLEIDWLRSGLRARRWLRADLVGASWKWRAAPRRPGATVPAATGRSHIWHLQNKQTSAPIGHCFSRCKCAHAAQTHLVSWGCSRLDGRLSCSRSFRPRNSFAQPTGCQWHSRALQWRRPTTKWRLPTGRAQWPSQSRDRQTHTHARWSATFELIDG